MRRETKLQVLPALPRDHDPVTYDAFHEDRVQRDLATFAKAPGLFEKYAERARIRFRKSGEKAILEHWISFYQAGERLIAAKTGMERKKSEYLQLAREHEVKEKDKKAELAKAQADAEEHALRRDKAAYQRKHIEQFMEPHKAQNVSDDEQKLNQARERRRLDTRWEVGESLRNLQTVIELQRWRREERDRILQDQSLSSAEKEEDLKLIDELYDEKRTELKTNDRIFKEE